MKKKLVYLSLAVALIVAFAQPILADVTKGDVIDKNNYQKIEGMVPDSVLNWVKNGEWVLNVGEMNYNPRDYYPAYKEELMKANTGKYDIKNGEIIDVTTGKMPDYIEGIPFPNVDVNDPQAGEKLLQNRAYQNLSVGSIRLLIDLIWVSEKGKEREASFMYYDQPLDGYSKHKDIPNPNNLMKNSLYKFIAPYDISGTAQMLHRYRENSKRDMLFAYVPSIRRVRRLTPANRTDGILGSDIVYDDAWLYDGKVADFEWKVIKKQIGLVPLVYTDPQPAELNAKGELKTTLKSAGLKYGWQVDGWQGVPWAPVNINWVKKPIYVIEAKSKDPYYNYGVQYFWLDCDTLMNGYKVIHDRSGNYWKTTLGANDVFATADGRVKAGVSSYLHSVDDRNRRSSYLTCWSKPVEWYLYADEDFEKFSLAGFQKFCK